MARNLFANDLQQQPTTRAPRNLFADQEPAEQESFIGKLPRNIATGLANMGHGLINAPYDLAEIIQQRGNEFGQVYKPLQGAGIPSPFPSKNYGIAGMIPHQEDQNFAQMLGQKGANTFADTVVQKGAQYAPEMLLGANALKALRGAGLMPHLTKRGALKKLKKGQGLASERDIGTLDVNPELIKDAEQYLPNNLPERNLLEGSNYGDYDSLFRLQSDLGKVSAARTGKISKLFSPETHLKGQAGLRSRNALLDAIHENLQGMGHHDISDLLRQGQADYRRYMNFRKYPRILGGAAAAYMFPKNALIDLAKNLWHAQ